MFVFEENRTYFKANIKDKINDDDKCQIILQSRDIKKKLNKIRNSKQTNRRKKIKQYIV